jgi:hypothetical protein
MNRFFVSFISAFLLVSVVYAENPGKPFQEINQKLDLTIEQMEVVKEQLEETNESLRNVAELVTGIKSGAKYWVSPSIEIYNRQWGYGDYKNAIIQILNGSNLQSARVTANYYNAHGDLQCTFDFEIEPKHVVRKGIDLNNCADTSDTSDPYGWIGWAEVIADNEVFVHGHIIRYKYYNNYDGYDTHSWPMAWYPVNDE